MQAAKSYSHTDLFATRTCPHRRAALKHCSFPLLTSSKHLNYQVVCRQWEELVLEKLFPDEKVCSGIVCEQSREIFGQLNRNVYHLSTSTKNIFRENQL